MGSKPFKTMDPIIVLRGSETGVLAILKANPEERMKILGTFLFPSCLLH